MLSDRLYMRDSGPEGRTSPLIWIVSAIASGYILQLVFLRLLGAGTVLERIFGLSPFALRTGRLWTLLTYSFLHDSQNPLYVIATLLSLYFLGREILPLLGNRRFLGLYAAAVAVGGAAFTWAHWSNGEVLLGASAAVAAFLVVFACFYPNQQISFLLFFVVPVTVKPKYLAIGAAALDLCGFFFYEVMGAPSPFGFAHSAHLGGMAVGLLYYRFFHEAEWRGSNIELPRWMKRAARHPAPPPVYRVNLGNREDVRAEVDRILDKINSQGFGSLTPEEKRVLDEAREALSKR